MQGPADAHIRPRLVLLEGGHARALAFLLVAFLIFVTQSVLLHRTPFFTDFAALMVTYLALESGLVGGAVMSLLIGYLSDLFSGESRGLAAGAMVLLFLILRLSVVRLTGARWLPITLISVLATLMSPLLRLVLERVVGPGAASLGAVLPIVPSLIASAVLFGFPSYAVLRFVDARFVTREEGVPLTSFSSRRKRRL